MNDILVVGAGPTGLTMAAELARHGAGCRIIDKASGPAVESRAIGIVPRTMEVFDTMGVVDPVDRAAHRLRGAGVYAGGRRIARFRFDDLDTRHSVAVLQQGETERILAAHLARSGVTVEREVELVGLSRETGSVSARLRHRDGREETHRSGWLIACDGARSTVRHALGVYFTGEPYEETLLLADVHLESALPWEESYSFFHPSGQLLMFPLPNDLVRVVAILGERSRDPVPAEPTLADMQALVDERGPGGVRLTDAVWISRFRVQRRMVRRFRHGRVFLAGDAAHVHSPAGGQGMNTGIQDAHNLAWKLALFAAGRSPESLLDSYHAEREPIARAVLRMTDRLTRLATLENPLAQRARNLLLSWLAGIGPVERRLVGDIAELNIDYRRSPVVAEERGGPFPDRLRKAPPAGTRAPDAELAITGSTRPARLHELLRDPRHALLLFAGPHPTPDERQRVANVADEVVEKYSDRIAVHVLSESGTDVERRYGVDAPWVYLVRPDGYVGFRGRPEIARLEEYLRRIFL